MGRLRMRYTVRLDHTVKKYLGAKGAEALSDRVGSDIKIGALNMARYASANAPVLTGALRDSIVPTIEQEGKLKYTFGSPLPYAQLQEYKHSTKNAYFRRAIWAGTPTIEEALIKTIKTSPDPKRRRRVY